MTGIMGWSSTAMAARHQYVMDPIRRQVVDQVGVRWGRLLTRPENQTGPVGAAVIMDEREAMKGL